MELFNILFHQQNLLMHLEDLPLKGTGTESGYTLPSSGARPGRACCWDLKAYFTQQQLRSELALTFNREKKKKKKKFQETYEAESLKRRLHSQIYCYSLGQGNLCWDTLVGK